MLSTTLIPATYRLLPSAVHTASLVNISLYQWEVKPVGGKVSTSPSTGTRVTTRTVGASSGISAQTVTTPATRIRFIAAACVPSHGEDRDGAQADDHQQQDADRRPLWRVAESQVAVLQEVRDEVLQPAAEDGGVGERGHRQREARGEGGDDPDPQLRKRHPQKHREGRRTESRCGSAEFGIDPKHRRQQHHHRGGQQDLHDADADTPQAADQMQ